MNTPTSVPANPSAGIPAVFQRLPRGVQQEALLRIE